MIVLATICVSRTIMLVEFDRSRERHRGQAAHEHTARRKRYISLKAAKLVWCVATALMEVINADRLHQRRRLGGPDRPWI